MKKRIVGTLLLTLMVLASLVGCGSSYEEMSENVTEEYTYDGASEKSMSFAADSSEGMSEPSGNTDSEIDSSEIEKSKAATSSRKIVYTADITVQTNDYNKNVDVVKSLVKKYNGYFESTNMSGTEKAKDRSASFTVRIPVDSYDKFMEGIGQVETVVSKTESAEDITSQYVDVQARLKSLNNKKARLEEFEAQATKLEDVIDLENQISDVQYQIESYTATLNTYKDMTTNCTINISIEEVREEVDIDAGKLDTFAKRMKEAALNSIMVFKIILEGIITVIIYLLPYGVLVALVLFIIIKVKKSEKYKKRVEDKKAKNTDGKEAYKGPSYSSELQSGSSDNQENKA